MARRWYERVRAPVYQSANPSSVYPDAHMRCKSALPPLSPVAQAMAVDSPATMYQFPSTDCAAPLIDRGSAGINGVVHNCPDVSVAPCASIANAGNGFGLNILADLGQYVSMGANYSMVSGAPFSMEIWCQLRGYWNTTQNSIIGKSQFRHGYNAPKIGDYLLSWNSSPNLNFSYCYNNLLYGWGHGSTFNTCHQLVITIDTALIPVNPLKGYIDGAAVGALSAGPDSIFGPPYANQGVTALDVGAATANLGPGLPYDARMDIYVVGFYNAVLTPAQVAAHWAAA